MTDPTEYVDPDDFSELHAEIHDLLRADVALVEVEHDPARLRQLVAAFVTVVREAAEFDRRMALVLRRQPGMADRIASALELRAEAVWPRSDDEWR